MRVVHALLSVPPCLCVLRGQNPGQTIGNMVDTCVLPTSGSSDVIGGNRGGYNILT